MRSKRLDHVTQHATDRLQLVTLDPDHPGFRDRGYRSRRNAIAQQALDFSGLGEVPDVAYTEAELEVWQVVCERLEGLHADRAVPWMFAGGITLPRSHVPQLAEVNRLLAPLTGFRLRPVAGLVEGSVFLSMLASKTFLSTQYLRHPSRPFFTPEPDLLHEIVGHAVLLGQADYARIHRRFGEASQRARTAQERDRLDRLYWCTMEFGLCEHDGQPRALGAGLLSSVGELERIDGSARIEAFDEEAILETAYDPTTYQPVLYVLPERAKVESLLSQLLLRIVP